MFSLNELSKIDLREDPKLFAAIVAGAVVLFFFLRFVFSWIYRACSLRKMKGPSGVPLLGSMPFLLSEPWVKFARYAKTYGSVYKLWVWNVPYVIISDPQIVQDIFNARKERYYKGNSYKFMDVVLGRGLVTSEGIVWRKHRELLKPAFHFSSLDRLHHFFLSASQRFNESVVLASQGMILQGNPNAHLQPYEIIRPHSKGVAVIESSAAFRQIALEVISAIALGLSPEKAGVFPYLFENILDELNHRVFMPYRVCFPTVQRAHLRRVRDLNRIVFQQISDRRAALEERLRLEKKEIKTRDFDESFVDKEREKDDVVSEDIGTHCKDIFDRGGDMLDMILESGSGLSDQQIADELKTQLLAGHETSASMMTWTLYLLAAHPEAMKRATEEARRLLVPENPSKSDFVGPAKYKELVFLEASLKEALRVYTPVPIVARETLQWDELNGQRVPPGTQVLVSIAAMHKDKEIWGEDVDNFVPDRFLDKNARRHPYAFMPFSMGPRVCIGQHLAMAEAKVVLGNALRDFDITLVPGDSRPVQDKYIIPVRPQGGLRLLFKPIK